MDSNNLENNPVENSAPAQATPITNPVKPKSKFDKHTVIFILFIIPIILFAAYLIFLVIAPQEKQTSKIKQSTSLSNTPSSVAIFKTIELTPLDLNDNKSSIIFSDANKIYRAPLNGAKPSLVATLPHNISSVDVIPDGSFLILTDNSKYEKVTNKKSGESDYQQVLGGISYWLLKSNSTKPMKLEDAKGQALQLSKYDGYPKERIFTKELENGQAEILLDKLDGSVPVKIGLLNSKLISPGCEFDPCPVKKHPGEFYPSFDGSYLLNKPPGGGGLGESAIVVSRDGTKTYKIDFYWYSSSAVWIGIDKLLATGQDGKEKLFTFKPDGTSTDIPYFLDFAGYFSPQTLSPNKKLLAAIDDLKQVQIIDLVNNKILPIASATLRYTFLGWNMKSDKLLYGVSNENQTIRKVYIFDINTRSSQQVAELNPNTGNVGFYNSDIPTANINHFDIF